MDEKIDKAAESLDADKAVISVDTGKTVKAVSKRTVGNKPESAKRVVGEKSAAEKSPVKKAGTTKSATANTTAAKSKTPDENIKNTKPRAEKSPAKKVAMKSSAQKAEESIIAAREESSEILAVDTDLSLSKEDILTSAPFIDAVLAEQKSNIQDFEISCEQTAIAEDERANNIIDSADINFGAADGKVFYKKRNDKKIVDNIKKSSSINKDGADIFLTKNMLNEAVITADKVSNTDSENSGRKVTLKLTDLTKKFGERISVDKVNLEVYEGEVFGFLGPNGAGKTTTIRMITGLASITSGEVHICGKSMKTDFRGALNNIGGIIENPEMYKYMSGWDNLKYYASLYSGITDEKIMEVVKLVRMENRIHEKVKRYSLGMRQRVGIAQSLLHSPKLLLLDEPTNGLDPKGIHEMRDFLKMLAHVRGLSVFISSHILTEMQLMCDRVAIISQGKCIAIKSVDEWTQEGTTKKVKLSVPNAVRAAELIREKFNIEVQTNGNLLVFTIDDSKIADISILLAASKIPVLSLVVGEKSLEETFLELTSQDNMIIT